MRKMTLEEAQKKIDSKSDEDLSLLQFSGYNGKCVIECRRCKKRYSFSQYGNAIRKIEDKKGICKECYLIPKKRKSFEQSLRDLFPGEEFSVLLFSGIKKPAIIKCGKCGKEDHYQVAGSIKKKQHICSDCFPQNYKHIVKLKHQVVDFFNNSDQWKLLSSVDELTSAHDKIMAECKRCGYISSKIPYLYFKGIGCSKCKENLKRTTEDFAKLLDDDYELLNEYVNDSTKVLLRHKTCGFIWNVTPDAYLHQLQRCPKCKRFHSKGEKRIEQILIKYNILYDREYPVTINGHVLRMDFYLPEYEKYIEFNGIQHYEPNHFSQTEDDFKRQCFNDDLKVKHFKDRLLVIPYNKFDEIEDLVKMFLSSTTISKESTL